VGSTGATSPLSSRMRRERLAGALRVVRLSTAFVAGCAARRRFGAGTDPASSPVRRSDLRVATERDPVRDAVTAVASDAGASSWVAAEMASPGPSVDTAAGFATFVGQPGSLSRGRIRDTVAASQMDWFVTVVQRGRRS
jgi:hypothetical protein